MSKTPMEPRVPASIIVEAARAADAVNSIDAIIDWLKMDKVGGHAKRGEAIRDVFGRNRVSRLPDAVIGEVCWRALIDALLMERADLTETWSHLVEFPGAPAMPPPSFQKGGEA